MTAEQLFQLPADGMRHELVEGVLRTMAPAGFEHGLVAATLLARVQAFATAHRLGRVLAAETGFVLRRGPDTVRAPDVAFVRADRMPTNRVTGFADLVPDLVAEVVSPSDRASDVVNKVLAWLDAGVALVWVADSGSRTVTTYRPGVATVLRGDDVLRGADDVLPGFALPLGELWA